MAEVPEEMRAAVLKGPGRIEVEAVPVPEVGAGDVLVAVDLCGICGSDLHTVLEGWGRPGGWGGHEWTGTVVAVGPEAPGWSEGDPVVGRPAPGCGTCRMCRHRRPSLCENRDTPGTEIEHGAFATYKLSPGDSLLSRPPDLDPRAAALTEPLAVALHGIRRSGIEPGMTAMVIGAGPIGALSIAALRAMGATRVDCVEPAEHRRGLAEAAGATTVHHPSELVVPTVVEPGRVVDGAVDVVLECSGKAPAMEAGLAQLVRGGTLVLVGVGMEAPRFDPNRILLNELTVTGAFEYDHDGFERALEMLASGVLPVEDLLEPGHVPLDGILEAMHGLAGGRLAGKVLVRP